MTDENNAHAEGSLRPGSLRRTEVPIRCPVPSECPHGQAELIAKVYARMGEMQESHDLLYSRVSQLEAEMNRTSQCVQETTRLVRGPSSPAERLFRRAILFAHLAAVKALHTTHAEMNRTIPYLCPANSIRQITLRSKSIDCTLYDFRLLASRFLQNTATNCAVFPSEYRVMKCTPTSVPCSEILFDTYADLCEALQIPGDIRERVLYREKKNTMRKLRSVQVLGVQLVGQDDRMIFPCKSYDARKVWRRNQVPVLHQRCLTWSEGTWETGFVLRKEIVPDSPGLCTSSPSGYGFLLKWEPAKESYSPRDASPESVAGSLQALFPAVVARTVVLTSTIQEIFSNNEGSPPLKQRLCSSTHTSESNAAQ